ncbi:hypothetical protein BASA83_005675 [Batrachochytrium salamandrivorans]|nr:hypothetical protein BASA83_005675 [Batrachochytrium salamandrivorans]
MGKAYYGLELVGGTSRTLHHCRQRSTRVSDCSLVPRLSTAIGPLLVETGIGSLLTRSLVSRVRLLERSVTKRTPINAICSVQTMTCLHECPRAVGKIPALVLVSSDQTAIQEQILADTTSQTKDSQATTSFALMETLRTCGDSASLQTRKAIQIGILVDTHPFSVDHHIMRPATTQHIPLPISWWSVNKSPGHRIQSGLVPAIQKSRLRLLGRALDPGVENVYTWLRGGVLNGEADLDQRWLDGTVEHESMGTRHDNRALAARLADFLQVAYRQYQSTLWKYHRDRLVEVG